MTISEAAAAALDTACDAKARLTRVFVVASSDYTRALQVLNLRAGVMKKLEYDKLRGYSESVGRTAEETRTALHRHTAEHGC
jgi:hypothetical protein